MILNVVKEIVHLQEEGKPVVHHDGGFRFAADNFVHLHDVGMFNFLRRAHDIFLVGLDVLVHGLGGICIVHGVGFNFFKGRKDIVLRLRSGDNLQYKDGYLLNEQSINIIALSASGKDKLKAWTDKGYEVTSAKVSYTLAWKPQDSDVEYAVCLANTVLSKVEEKNESIT